MTQMSLKKSVKEIQALSKTIPMLADALNDMKEYGLSERALVVLAADAAGLGRTQTERLFNGFKKMKKLYLRKPKQREERNESNEHTI